MLLLSIFTQGWLFIISISEVLMRLWKENIVTTQVFENELIYWKLDVYRKIIRSLLNLKLTEDCEPTKMF